ncbi:phosphatase PAP2 family protein [Azohydromonas caseinilytica]|uniref:Phosphatase PAP2 family protein n=1 Tax=Azohydromonas caseinilytica TaxID=2728836 RepID=A0A848FHC4_9BURK|nr:phosphatase PAP2 family protein [Azohydromonas caseinilytica]NML18878.1 phosphatase PAP2 family protein [Azohydromonas caseinilytica]
MGDSWWRRRPEPRVLGALLAAAAALWLFIALSEEVGEGETHAVDRAILLMLRNPADPSDPLGPRWFEEFMRDLTALGGHGVLGLLLLAVSSFLLLAGLRRTAAWVLAACLSGALLSDLLKGFFARPRPDLVPHGAYVLTSSFPSGHAMLSALVYLTLAALVARLLKRRRLRLHVMTVAVLLTLLVGISRVYLGVHWPSDVLAGWAIGAAWALAWWGIAQWLQPRPGTGSGEQ